MNLYLFKNFDLLLTHEFDHPVSKNYLSKRICNVDMFLLYGKNHKLYGKQDLSIKDFNNELIWTTDKANTHERISVVEKILSYYNIQSYHTESTSNFDNALLNISLGNGIALLDPFTIPMIGSGFATLPIAPEAYQMGMDITWNKNNLNPAIPLFVSLLPAYEK